MLYRPSTASTALVYAALDQSIINAWGLTAVAMGSLDFNRVGVPIDLNNSVFTGKQIKPYVTKGFKWNTDDSGNAWLPQGLTSSADADAGTELINGKKFLLQSWHDNNTRIRVSFVDISNLPTSVVYRNALLVEPYNHATYGASFKNIPIHAGGIALYKHWLFVMDTLNGIRVFDTNQILEVPEPNDTSKMGKQSDGSYHAQDYKYIVPQVAKYTMSSQFQHRWSYCCIDQSDPDHPKLVTGEWSTSEEARLFWWEIDPTTGLLTLDPVDHVRATDLNLNGVHSYDSGGGVTATFLSTHTGSKLLKRGIDDTSDDGEWTTPGLPQNMTRFAASDELWITHESPRVVYTFPRSSL